MAYFLSWPTLGSAIILVMMPSEDKMRQVRHLPLQKHFPLPFYAVPTVFTSV